MKKFVTISGNRAGSTWYQHMMNSIKGVSSDYEAQLEMNVPTPQHLPLLKESFSLENILESLASEEQSHVVGTKIVLPGIRRYTDSDFEFLKRILSDYHIIHIGRDYFDSYYSKFLNRGHLLNEQGRKPAKHTKYWLSKEEKNTFVPREIDLKELEKDLSNRLNNEKLILKHLKTKKNYQHIEYDKIPEFFIDSALKICKEIDKKSLEEALKSPSTKKHKEIKKSDSINNYSQVIEIENEYRMLRKELFL
ncbi:hypothetical protein MGA5115_00409 [Marinomonas gallaica]|uniref:Stf0 sulfotransferase n=1 Tax=Marinomonas gallaica TaxID=1806667 RepID=A0A1C3JMG7_9GAMM|nr:hypothetical protein [Marinomonas gallaica]SBT16329.1 hypothetical protein MGA5115_00409 [Marinomonas gallaica]SBT21377.1 hypothetical protein MGA5116_01970 [Marinomonas gallaica]